MKIYTIALYERVCHGHASYGDEWAINTMGDFGSGEYPPCFVTKKEAEDWLSTCTLHEFRKKKIVELNLRDATVKEPDEINNI